MHRCLPTLALLLALQACQQPAPEPERLNPLAGVKQLAIRVAKLDEAALAAGVSHGRLAEALATQLSEMGIEIVAAKGAVAILQVELKTQPSAEGQQYVYALSLDLLQPVRLAREPKKSTLGSIWDTGSLGLLEASEMPDAVYTALDKLLGVFAKSYTTKIE